MKSFRRRAYNPLWIMSIFVLVWVVALSAVFFVKSKYNFVPQLVESWTASTDKRAFPDVDTSHLSKTQQEMLGVLKEEYAAQPKGAKYAGGVEEPWCADFVSWVLNRVDEPLINPNTDSWRIPGTRTMRDYYEATDRFKDASADYAPKLGDVVFYDNPSPYGQHVNFVLSYENGQLTTIGGNEPGGIRISTHAIKEDPGFLGYGTL